METEGKNTRPPLPLANHLPGAARVHAEGETGEQRGRSRSFLACGVCNVSGGGPGWKNLPQRGLESALASRWVGKGRNKKSPEPRRRRRRRLRRRRRDIWVETRRRRRLGARRPFLWLFFGSGAPGKTSKEGKVLPRSVVSRFSTFFRPPPPLRALGG